MDLPSFSLFHHENLKLGLNQKNIACSSTAPSAQLFTRAEPGRQIEPIWLATAGCCRRLIFQTLAVVPVLQRAAAAFRLAKSAKPERGRTQQARAKKKKRKTGEQGEISGRRQTDLERDGQSEEENLITSRFRQCERQTRLAVDRGR